jgi:Rieske Fe-S protein
MSSDEKLPGKCLACNRRQAIKLGAMGAAGLAMGATFTGCGDPAGLEQDVVLTLTDYPALGEVGGIANVPSSASGFEFEIWVIRQGEEDYLALSSECNHASCEVDLDGSNGFKCPCHGSEFELDGTKTKGPATKDLLAFDTQLDGETLTLKAGA